MIFYFSATGNSKYVAERIASALKTDTVDIAGCMHTKSFVYQAAPGEPVGIVCPTYFWGLPSIVKDFLDNLTVTPAGKLFFIATYGTTTGQTGRFADMHLRRNGMKIDAFFSVKMPDIWTPFFNLTDKDKVAYQNEKAEPQIDAIIKKLQADVSGNHMEHQVPMFASKLYHGTYGMQRKTSHLHVEDSCIGCGICAGRCPVNAIELRDGKPVWIKNQCVMCLGCLHRCPKFAIQYGRSTKKHGQYKNPHTKV